ncbi:MAG: electron transporter RnfE [Rhodospirillaceae bacterium]|nr:MAG: electron transporter RnfE [Rhodospirillaceae bacterium]
MGNFGEGGSLWYMGFHGLFSLVIMGLLIYGVVAIIGHFSNSNSGNIDPALTALGERYAKGEINRDEYLEKKKDLEG